MAGFEVSTYGRIWVSTEDRELLPQEGRPGSPARTGLQECVRLGLNRRPRNGSASTSRYLSSCSPQADHLQRVGRVVPASQSFQTSCKIASTLCFEQCPVLS